MVKPVRPAITIVFLFLVDMSAFVVQMGVPNRNPVRLIGIALAIWCLRHCLRLFIIRQIGDPRQTPWAHWMIIGHYCRAIVVRVVTARRFAVAPHRRGWRVGAAMLMAGLLPVFGAGLSGCAGLSDGPPIPLANVDLDRMYGGWYLIATIRNGFEKGMVAPYDVYSRRPDGDIREDFSFHDGSFQAPLRHYVVHDWVRLGTNNAHWRVQILWPIDLPFLVLYTDPDYRYVLYGEKNRKLGWIYARQPTIPDTDYQAMLERFGALGYDTGDFVKFVQTPAQIGQPGFWSDGIE